MKKIYSLGRNFCLFALPALAAACGREIIPDAPAFVTSIIEATTCENFKTVLSGKDVLWTESDTLTLFSYAETPVNWSLQTGIVPKSIDGKKAKFEITTQSGLQPRILVNPESDQYLLRADGSVKITLPSRYDLEPGKAPQESMISVGLIDSGKVVMRNVLSYMKFTIESDIITRVRIRTNDSTAISGTLYFNPATLETEVEGDDCFYVYPADTASSTFAPGVYYVPVPAVSCAKGLNVKFYKENGDAAKKGISTSYNISRNKFIDMGKESEWGLQYQPSSKEVKIVFWYSDGCVFPFSLDSAATTKMATPPTYQEVIADNISGPYYPVGYPGVKVYFYLAPLNGKTKSYFVSQGSYGMRYGVWTGDYMTIPALPDYRLTALSVGLGSKTAYYGVTTDPVSGPTETLTTFSGKDKTVTKTFTSSQTKPGTSYRIIVTSDDYPTSIKNVTYTYEIVD